MGILDRHKNSSPTLNNRSSHNKNRRSIPRSSTNDIITALQKVDLEESELADIWSVMCRCIRKKFNINAIRVNGQVYDV